MGPFIQKLRLSVIADWQKILTHPFLVELVRGVLPRTKFDYYLSQDDHYLQDLLSTLGILVAKSCGETKRFAVRLLYETLHGEITMHEVIAKEGKTKTFPRGEAASAYGDFLLRTAYEGDALDILVAICPCFWSYLEIGEQLFPQIETNIPSVYRFWVESYVSDGYRRITSELLTRVEEELSGVSERKHVNLVGLFQRATWFEYRFWEESYAFH
ncbi:MAG: hypothetical protein ABDK94_01600 [Atribacterota bacterium]